VLPPMVRLCFAHVFAVRAGLTAQGHAALQLHCVGEKSMCGGLLR
jgi:hypothetical protein